MFSSFEPSRYTLRSLIGEGGSARVYRAELRGPMGFIKPVAIKVFKPEPELKRNERKMRDFIREARLGGSCAEIHDDRGDLIWGR